ncbi:undecaprenyl-phosphate galactose phosphotransferase WbaP [Deinococcus gobiensis]|uniref:UDP-galactose-lipid carrier transferase n=1 Tax=Deinococcus gobiensis (strain DSM 21396 / JCM 16679 / CGMCC 1.7299 / I-0) TaxID=745776 RepID=H8H090_DEIGI|nr:undecaprenyl-phosphate galactose phosphotransferase WbaP [Deinococcus gobiensis]AFD27142.1 UDP-galactose-lipid carrier transferase [Deinococcus gobiensis I-0]
MGLPSVIPTLPGSSAHERSRLTELPQSLILLLGDLAVGLFAAGLCVLFLNSTSHLKFDWATYVVWLSLWIIWRAYQGLYPGYGRSAQTELRLHTVGTIQLLGAQLAAVFAAHQLYITFTSILLQWTMILLFALPVRYLLRIIMIRAGYYGRTISIIGAGQTAVLAIHQLKFNPSYGLRPVAAYDDNPALQGDLIEGVPIVGTLEDALNEPRTKQALISIPGARAATQQNIINRFYSTFQITWVIPDLIGVPNHALQPHHMGSIVSLEIRNNLSSIRARFVKRTIDIVISLLILIIVIPFFIIIGLVIKLDSPGPIFYKASRVGLKGKTFPCYKFRSMYLNAEQRLIEMLKDDDEKRAEYDLFHKLREDPRITPFGSLLRKTSLDELPQLVNVLLGQMSLVGPRPYLPRELSKMSGFTNEILSVTPGMTGYWQVNERSGGTFEGRLNMDKFYITNWSPWLDLIILLQTIRVVLIGKGAY